MQAFLEYIVLKNSMYIYTNDFTNKMFKYLEAEHSLRNKLLHYMLGEKVLETILIPQQNIRQMQYFHIYLYN